MLACAVDLMHLYILAYLCVCKQSSATTNIQTKVASSRFEKFRSVSLISSICHFQFVSLRFDSNWCDHHGNHRGASTSPFKIFATVPWCSWLFDGSFNHATVPCTMQPFSHLSHAPLNYEFVSPLWELFLNYAVHFLNMQLFSHLLERSCMIHGVCVDVSKGYVV